MSIQCSLIMLLGRISISAIFIFAGLHKFMDYGSTAEYMASKNMSMIPFFLYAAAFVELIGGLLVLLGYKARCGALLLALFLLPVTFIFHDFWNVEDIQVLQSEMIHFFSNFAIFGGLLYVYCCGAGACSIDGEA